MVAAKNVHFPNRGTWRLRQGSDQRRMGKILAWCWRHDITPGRGLCGGATAEAHRAWEGRRSWMRGGGECRSPKGMCIPRAASLRRWQPLARRIPASNALLPKSLWYATNMRWKGPTSRGPGEWHALGSTGDARGARGKQVRSHHGDTRGVL